MPNSVFVPIFFKEITAYVLIPKKVPKRPWLSFLIFKEPGQSNGNKKDACGKPRNFLEPSKFFEKETPKQHGKPRQHDSDWTLGKKSQGYTCSTGPGPFFCGVVGTSEDIEGVGSE
jgi:hypothetical protein